MPWRQLQDPNNLENRNAGNAGDHGKHTVYLTVLDYLLAKSPWSTGLRVRECHAGRGMYHIPAEDRRRRRLRCSFDPLNADVGVLLHDVQRASQTALGVWPAALADLEWYGGSAMVNAWRLGYAPSGEHLLELYELAAETRAVLREVFAAPGLELPRATVQILPNPENAANFDGELHIEQNIAEWDTRDLVLLDPFAMWRQRCHEPQRDRYRRIIEGLIQRGEESPSLILFWTWGNAFPVADGDLNGTNEPVGNGYQELRNVLHQANRHFIRVTWRWDLQFAMWVLLPSSHLEALSAAIQLRCDELRDHLLHRGYTMAHPDIHVVVD